MRRYINLIVVTSTLLSLFIASVFPPLTASASPLLVVTIVPTKTDTLNDLDGDNKADPGETIDYTVVIPNSGDTAATGVTFQDIIDLNTTLVGGSLNVSPLAADDTYSTIGNTLLDVGVGLPDPAVHVTNPATDSLFDNDTEFLGDTFTLKSVESDTTAPFTTSTEQGGSVTVEGDGNFSYTPPVGFSGTDNFDYVLTDDGPDDVLGNSDDLTGAGRVTINVTAQRVWYVKNDSAPGGLGRSNDPFDTLLEAQTASAANDTIYVFTGSGNTGQNAGFILKNGQRFLGNGVALTVLVSVNGGPNPTTLRAAGTRPTIGNSAGDGVTLSTVNIAGSFSGVEIRGLDISGAGAGTNAVDVTTHSTFGGSFELADNVISAAVAEGVDVNGGGSGTLTVSIHDNTVTATGNGIDVLRTAGNVNIVAFDDNVVSGNTGGIGINIVGPSVTFDVTSGGAFQTVSGGATTIGASGNPVGTAGMVLTNVSGDLSFTDLDIFANSGDGLNASGTTPYTGSAGFQIAVTPASPDNVGTSTINTASGPALNISQATVDLRLSNLTSTTTTSGLSLTTIAGQVRAPSGSSITKSSGAGTAFSIASSSATVNYAGSLNVTSGSGVSLTSNTGATINFMGGMTLSTGSNAAFSATGGGTVNVCDENPCNPGATGGLVNTLTSSTGTALNVSNTTIGSNNLEFRSISANGASKGIILNTTGSSGGLKVVGTSTTDGSGGTIQNISTRGAEFISTSNVSLKNMTFTNAATTDGDADNSGLTTGDNLLSNAPIYLQTITTITLDNIDISGSAEQGINGNNVNGLTLSNSTILNAGNGPDEDGLHFYNLSGTNSITNTSITSSGDDNVNIQNNTNTASISTVSTINVTNGSFNTGVLGSGLLFGIRGTFNTTINISGVTCNNNFSGGIVIDTYDTATSDLDITGVTSTNNNDGISLSSNNGSTKFDIHDNVSFAGNDFGRINVLKAAFSTGGTLEGRIHNNPIVVTDGQTTDGVTVQNLGAGTLKVLVTNNTFDYRGTQRALYIAGGQDGNATVEATVTGNAFDIKLDGTGNAVNAILAQVAVASPSGDPSSMCIDIGGAGGLSNTFTHSMGGTLAGGDIRVRQRFVSNVRMPGYAGGGTDTTAAASYLDGRNTEVSASTFSIATSITGGAACAQPVLAMIPGNEIMVKEQPSNADSVLSVASLDTIDDVTVGVQSKLGSSQYDGTLTLSTNAGGGKALSLIKQPAPVQSGETVGPVNIGTLPAGKSVTIKFQVTVDALDSGEIRTQISNQGTVSWDTAQSALTDDPSAGGVSDPTVTPVDRPDTTVSLINRQTPSGANTNASSVTWRVTFANAVAGLTTSNFSLTDVSSSITGESISSVTAVTGSPDTQWDVTVSTGTGDGTLRLNLANDTGLSHDVTNAPYTSGQTYAIDKIAPLVSSIVRQSPGSNPTNANVLVFRVTFNEAVTSVGASSFVVNGTTTTITSVGSVTPNLVFDFTLDGTVNGDLSGLTGTVGLNIAASPVITDLAGNTLQVVEPTPASTNDQTFMLDNTAPVATSFNRSNPASTPTNADTLIWQVIFSEDVTGVDADGSDFTVPALTGETISVSSVNASTYTVTVSGGDLSNFNGLVDLDFVASPTINDLVGNAMSSTIVGFDQHYVMDNDAPTVSMSSTATNPTGVSPIPVSVTFSESVTGFTSGDIVAGNGTVSNFAGSGANYTFDLTPSSAGLVTADIAAGVAQDAVGNNNSAASQFSRTYDNTAPTVSMSSAAPDPTSTSPIPVTVTFSESVNNFTAGDILAGNGTVNNFAGSGANYTFDLTLSSDGTVTADIAAGVAQDLAGNNNTAAAQFSRLYDTGAPTVTIEQASGQSDPTSTSPINFTVTFSENVMDFDDATDVSLTGTAGATTINITGGPKIYNVAVSGMTGPGTVIASVPASVAVDLASHPNDASPATGDRQVTYVPPADLSITKTDGVTTAVPGGSVTYTITASNAGPNADSSATVADTLPASLTATWTCVGAGGGTCTASGSGNINDTVNLPVGGSVTYTVTATISASATGSLSNTATVSTGAGVGDPTPANNSATDTNTLTPQADLSITKTDGVTTATPGGSVTYTITASNAGPSNAPGSTVADTFPASLTATWTCVGVGGGTCTASGSGNINDTVNLPAGGSVTYTVSATISASATGTLSNTATVAAPGGVTDPVPGNNSATDSDALGPQADLAITKTDGVTTAAPGGSVTYTITASNAGPSNASGATVADTFPASLTATWTCVGAGGGTCTASGSGNISDTVNLPAGGSVTYTVSATISPAATGTLSNTATVSSGVTDPNPANNSATDNDTLVPQADLSITKTDGVSFALAGNSVTYTITASNAGPGNATGVTVADTFPASLSGVTWNCVGAGGGTCTASGSGNINETTVNLPAGGSVTFTATGTLSISATGTLSNTATVSSSITDPTSGNNSATDSDTIVSPVAVTINKAAGQADPTNASPVNFTVTFASAVTDFDDATDVTLSGTASATTVNITGGPTTYNVEVSGMTGDGTVIATVPAGVVTGAQGETNLASTSTDNSVIYDGLAPTLTINQAVGQSDTTSSSPVNFTAVFSEAVTGFDGSDITFGGTAGATTATVTGGPIIYNVAVSGMTTSGTITVSIPASVATDSAGNNNTASTTTTPGDTDTITNYTFIPLTVTIDQASSQADPTSASLIHFTVVFSEPVTGFIGPDVDLSISTVTSTLAAAVTQIAPMDNTTYDVVVYGMASNGDVVASIPANKVTSISRGVGTVNEASTSTDNTVSYIQLPSTQRLKNRGFNQYVGLSKIPKAWKATRFTWADGRDLTNYPGKEGLASVKIIAAPDVTKTLQQTIKLGGSTGDVFTFSFKEKGSAIPAGGICRGQVLLYNGTTLVQAKSLNCTTGTHNFKLHQTTFMANANYTKIVVKFQFKKNSGMVWFDLASLKR